MNDRTGQVWAYIDEPDMIRVMIRPYLMSHKETYVAYYVELATIDEFETEALEADDKWERLA